MKPIIKITLLLALILIPIAVFSYFLPEPFSGGVGPAKPVFTSFVPNSKFTYSITLYGPIDQASAEKVSKVLMDAKVNETVKISVYSPGGEIMAGKQIEAAMDLTQAQVTWEVLSEAASMAASLSCYADKVYLAPGAELYFHNGRSINEMTGTIQPLDANGQAYSDGAQQRCLDVGIINQDEWHYVHLDIDNYVTVTGPNHVHEKGTEDA